MPFDFEWISDREVYTVNQYGEQIVARLTSNENRVEYDHSDIGNALCLRNWSMSFFWIQTKKGTPVVLSEGELRWMLNARAELLARNEVES